MGTIITLHSYSGGTGRSSLAIGLAEIFAMQGKRTCLLDVDFRAPTIGFRFEIEGPEFFMNDYLNGNCRINDVLIDYTSQCKCAGTMLVGLANPATEALRDMSAKDRKWEMRALGRLLSLKNTLLKEMKIDYLILDTSSGLQYSAINAIVSSDITLLVNNLDKTQVRGTQVLIEGLYDLFEKKTGMEQFENESVFRNGCSGPYSLDCFHCSRNAG